MRRSCTVFQIIAFAAIIVLQSRAQTGDAIFPKGELSTIKITREIFGSKS
jgi:hypothetical protein